MGTGVEGDDEHVLSWITFFPIIGMVVVLFLPRERLNLIRWTSAIASAVPLVLSIWLFATSTGRRARCNSSRR